jgi:hypothetical protein
MRVRDIPWSDIRAVGVELTVLLVYPLRHAHWPFLLTAEIPTLRWGEMPFAIGVVLLLTLPLPVSALWWFEGLGDLEAARICVSWLLLVTLIGAWTRPRTAQRRRWQPGRCSSAPSRFSGPSSAWSRQNASGVTARPLPMHIDPNDIDPDLEQRHRDAMLDLVLAWGTLDGALGMALARLLGKPVRSRC